MNRAFKLYRLQQADSQLDEALGRLAEIETALGEDKILQEALQAVEITKSEYQHAQLEMRDADEQAKAQQQHIDEEQAKLYGGKVSNPKELQDLQKESEVLTKRLSDLETVELEKMERAEQAEARLKEAEENLESVQAQRGVEVRTLGSELSKLKVEIERLTDERKTATHGIPDEDMALYESTRKAKGGLAVAKVINKECGACGAELSAALAQAARSADELARCSNCKRILYTN